MRITKEFNFEAAHILPWHKGLCQNLHGHSYKLFVTIEGPLNKNGIIMDFGDLKKIVQKKIIDKYDHSYLNNYFENPTCEIMVRKFLSILKSSLRVETITVRLYETATSCAEEGINGALTI